MAWTGHISDTETARKACGSAIMADVNLALGTGDPPAAPQSTHPRGQRRPLQRPGPGRFARHGQQLGADLD